MMSCLLWDARTELKASIVLMVAMFSDECPFALLHLEKSQDFQLLDRGSYGYSAYSELDAELTFGRKLFPLLPNASHDLFL